MFTNYALYIIDFPTMCISDWNLIIGRNLSSECDEMSSCLFSSTATSFCTVTLKAVSSTFPTKSLTKFVIPLI